MSVGSEKNQSVKNIGGFFFFLLVQLLRKVKMKDENETLHSYPCPQHCEEHAALALFPWNGGHISWGHWHDFPIDMAETVDCIYPEFKQKHLFAKYNNNNLKTTAFE